MTRIVCRQLSPAIADLNANIAATTAAIRESVATGARVVLVPELALSGYMLDSVEEARSVAGSSSSRKTGGRTTLVD